MTSSLSRAGLFASCNRWHSAVDHLGRRSRHIWNQRGGKSLHKSWGGQNIKHKLNWKTPEQTGGIECINFQFRMSIHRSRCEKAPKDYFFNLHKHTERRTKRESITQVACEFPIFPCYFPEKCGGKRCAILKRDGNATSSTRMEELRKIYVVILPLLPTHPAGQNQF